MINPKPTIIHYRIGDSYLCNGACFITLTKCTYETKEVTCKNCLGKVKKGKHKEP